MLYNRLFELAGVEYQELLLEASKEPSNIIFTKLNSINFPKQYIKWIALKLAKDLKERLLSNTDLNRPDLKSVLYEPEPVQIDTPEKTEVYNNLRGKFVNLFNSQWTSKYEQELTNIRDWIMSPSQDGELSFKSTLERDAGGKLETLQLEKARIRAKQWHDSLGSDNKAVRLDIVEEHPVILEYDDYYWMDNEKNRCSKKDGIGCTSEPAADTIITLKEKSSRKPIVSVAIKYGDVNAYIQAKAELGGRTNIKPPEELRGYIEDLLVLKKVAKYSPTHDPHSDFRPEDFKNEELIEAFAENTKKEQEFLSKLFSDLLDTDSDDEFLRIDIPVEHRAINRIFYTDHYSEYTPYNVLTGKPTLANDERRYSISDAWDWIREGENYPHNLEREGVDQDEFWEVFTDKLIGAVYIPEDHEHESMITQEKMKSFSIRELYDLLSSSDDITGESIKDQNKWVTNDHIKRLEVVRKIVVTEYYDLVYIDPLRLSNDSLEYTYNMPRELERMGIAVDHDSKSVTMSIPKDKISEIFDGLENSPTKTLDDVYSTIGFWFEDNDCSIQLYTYESDSSENVPFFFLNIQNALSNLPDLKANRIDHPDQLTFPNMTVESINRIKQLAGLLG